MSASRWSCFLRKPASRMPSSSDRRSETSVAQRERRTADRRLSRMISWLRRPRSTVQPAGRQANAHSTRVEDDALDRLEQLCDADIVVGEQIAQVLRRIPAASPCELSEISAVRDPEVLERNEEALIDGFPQSQLDGDPMLEPVGHI